MESDKPVRETRGSDDYYEELDRWYAEHTADGSQIYKLTRLQDELPEDVYNRFVETASADDAWSGTQYSWESTAYVVVQTTDNVTLRGPLLNTTWNQNQDVTPWIACAPVAIGQIMRFYEFPAAFPWNYMSDSDSNDASKESFLITIRNALNVDGKGNATIGCIKNVLKNYGYSISQSDHDATKIYSEITAGRPVLAIGEDTSRNEGHAWVIDGTRYSYTSVTYTLYILNSNCYPEFNYEDSGTTPWNQYSDLTTYHMNWGWGGDCNGWYLDYRIKVTPKDGTVREYSHNRKELLIRKP